MRKAADIKEVRHRGPSPEKTAQTRRAIVGAALAEFLEKGFADATMESVARRAGVAKGTPYRYFPTKEALFSGVVHRRLRAPSSALMRRSARQTKASRPFSGALCSQSSRISKRRERGDCAPRHCRRRSAFRLSSRLPLGDGGPNA